MKSVDSILRNSYIQISEKFISVHVSFKSHSQKSLLQRPKDYQLKKIKNLT